jgi:hypothetical protein
VLLSLQRFNIRVTAIAKIEDEDKTDKYVLDENTTKLARPRGRRKEEITAAWLKKKWADRYRKKSTRADSQPS